MRARYILKCACIDIQQWQLVFILIGTFRPDIAYRVMTECTGTIKKRVDLYPLIDKLVEKRMISEAEKDQVTDQNCGLTTDQRLDKLLGFVKASIKEDGEDFGRNNQTREH